MARRTTNYGWNISEGTDIVNPLTDIFPNFESQDTDLKNVSNCSIGTATELKTGTVHALTRDDSGKDVFKFTATSNFTAGDTFTVDGDQVSALTTAGEQLQTGCYIIGSEVLVLKKGTLLTMYVSSDNAVTLDGHSASYFATASDLSNTDGDVSALSTKVGTATLTTTAPDLSGAVNELNSNLSWKSAVDITAIPNTAKEVRFILNDTSNFTFDSLDLNYSQIGNTNKTWTSTSFYLNANTSGYITLSFSLSATLISKYGVYANDNVTLTILYR